MKANRVASPYMLLALLIELSAKAHQLEQANNMQTQIKQQAKAETFTVTAEQIEFLRTARVVWDPSESGAPIIDPEILYRSGLQGTHAALQIMLLHGSIAPGTYSLPNKLHVRYPDGEIQADTEGNTIVVPEADPIEFTLTEQHIKLLRNANTDALMYFGACGLNSKHPYGEMSYWEIDAAHILGIPVYRDQNGSPCFTEEELAFFRKLHHEMLFALPVFLQNAEITAEQFVRMPNPSSNWEPAA